MQSATSNTVCLFVCLSVWLVGWLVGWFLLCQLHKSKRSIYDSGARPFL